MTYPDDYGTGTVIGTWTTTLGRPGRGMVVFTPRPTFMVAAGDTIVLPNPVVARLVNGSISVTLAATDDPDVSPLDWTWRVEIRTEGPRVATFDIAVPTGSVIDLRTVVEVDPATGTAMVTGPWSASWLESSGSSWPTRARCAGRPGRFVALVSFL